MASLTVLCVWYPQKGREQGAEGTSIVIRGRAFKRVTVYIIQGTITPSFRLGRKFHAPAPDTHS